MDQGHKIHLANTAAIQQYEGLKYTDDPSDARWLAHLLRLGILPQGYIYPKEHRPVRDLLRKRGQMVRQRTMNLLSTQNLFSRNTGGSMSANRVKRLDSKEIDELVPNADLALAFKANLAMLQCADGQIDLLEKTIVGRVKLKPEFELLKTTPGIGHTLSLAIMLETGDISRFPTVGDYASYCRCVGSKKISNRKKKGKGNIKNGNKYLAWAYVEAANFAVRYNAKIRSFVREPLPKRPKQAQMW
jgi:transposase